MTMTTTTQAAGFARVRRHPSGAPLLPPVIAYSVLTVLAVVVPLAMAGKGAWTSDRALLDVYANHQGAVRVQALLTIAAAIPFAVLTAIFSDKVRQLGMRVPGRIIALSGGAGAAALLAVAGALQLALLGSHTRHDLVILQFGQRLSVALGGTAFVAFAGLLIAGIAVTGLLGRILPRRLAWAGIAVAVVGELALLTSLTDALVPLLPIERFGGIAWLIAAAATMRPRSSSPLPS
jgi:hypothetical protein